MIFSKDAAPLQCREKQSLVSLFKRLVTRESNTRTQMFGVDLAWLVDAPLQVGCADIFLISKIT